jgi:hypothetical protein
VGPGGIFGCFRVSFLGKNGSKKWIKQARNGHFFPETSLARQVNAAGAGLGGEIWIMDSATTSAT